MQNMTEGAIRSHVLRMMLFMLFGMFVQTLYALVDIWWVGHLGKQAIAAASVASNLMFVVIAVSQTLGVGTVALVSQAYGRRDEAAVQRLFNQSQSLSVIAGLVFLALGYASAATYAKRLASDAETAALVCQFLAWFVPAMALQFSMAGLGSALRGIGNMKPGLLAQTGSVLLNMILAPFLIFGWGTGHPLGVAGASLATFLATLAAVVALMFYLRRDATYLRVDFAQWRPDWALWRRMLLIGLPSGVEFLLMSVIIGLIYAVIRPFGAEAQAGFGIGMRIMQAGFMPAVALSFAAAAVAGQNYGARAHDRVRQTFVESAKLNIAFMMVFTLLCHLAPEAMMRLFSSDPVVVDIGGGYLRVISWNYVASGLILVAAGLFQGIGNTVPSLLASSSRLLFFVLPVWWLSQQPQFQLSQVWTLSVISVLLQMCFSLWLLRREFGLKLTVTA
ncbi:MAG: MATE family efflux transporter [Nevskiaceae bacterium]|nr:MAG: MATE family efflux transporter [Nevskiaceae bacterium]